MKKQVTQTWKRSMDLNACGVMENMNQKESEEWIDRVADEVEEKRLQNASAEKPEARKESVT